MSTAHARWSFVWVTTLVVRSIALKITRKPVANLGPSRSAGPISALMPALCLALFPCEEPGRVYPFSFVPWLLHITPSLTYAPVTVWAMCSLSLRMAPYHQLFKIRLRLVCYDE